MTPSISTRFTFENPNAVPLGKRVQPTSPTSSPSAMSRIIYHPPTQGQSRSPLQPVQPFKIYEDSEVAEEWMADKENLYDQIEKLTLRLDTANILASSQSQRIVDLEKVLKEKEILIKEYQKSLRNDRANKDAAHNATKRAIEQCERFKSEIVRLSHHIHYMHTAISNAEDACQLQVEFAKLKQVRDLSKDNLRRKTVTCGET